MSTHEYTWDIKMAAAITLKSTSKNGAAKRLARILKHLTLLADTGDARLNASIVEMDISIDDVAGPHLLAIDDEAVCHG